jgi:hypothetical protein
MYMLMSVDVLNCNLEAIETSCFGDRDFSGENIILMNILVTHIFFILTITWYLAYGCGQQRSLRDKNAGKSTKISMAMVMQRYNAGHIAR